MFKLILVLFVVSPFLKVDIVYLLNPINLFLLMVSLNVSFCYYLKLLRQENENLYEYNREKTINKMKHYSIYLTIALCIKLSPIMIRDKAGTLINPNKILEMFSPSLTYNPDDICNQVDTGITLFFRTLFIIFDDFEFLNLYLLIVAFPFLEKHTE